MKMGSVHCAGYNCVKKPPTAILDIHLLSTEDENEMVLIGELLIKEKIHI